MIPCLLLIVEPEDYDRSSKARATSRSRSFPRTLDRFEGDDMNSQANFNTDKLVEDLKVVMRDAEALLRATSAQTGEKIQEVRARAEESLQQARTRLTQLEDDAYQRAREAADAAEGYVRENPWQALGIAAGVGVLVGLLLSRR
jgi:ElaB/YqjD/DUF883 family membrane-anchored ribosome-binding protein